eukprot:RCo017867
MQQAGVVAQRLAALLHLQRGVDVPHEGEAAEEADSARHQEERVRDQTHVAEVQDDRGHPVHVHGGGKVVNGVEEEVQPRASGVQVAPPPPAVVLVAQLGIRQHNADLRTGHHQNQEHNREEPKDVVELVEPQRREDEVQLNERCAERHSACRQDQHGSLHVKLLLRDLPGDGADGLGVGQNAPLVPRGAPDEHQRHRHQEPQRNQSQKGDERRRAGGFVVPQHQVQHEENPEDLSGKPHAGQENGEPALLVEHLRQYGRGEASQAAHNRVQHQHRGHQPPPASRGQETKKSEDQRDKGHPQQLRARSHVHSQQGCVGRLAEDVLVHHLPPRLFLSFVLVFGIVVAVEVLV